MKLDQYISELLQEHECVIIPAFGGIVSNYKSSFLNPAHHTFSPPSRRLAFNASLRTNDGLLASHISKRLSVNYNEANSYISQFVNDCMKSLHNGEKLVLQQVGVLYLDQEQNLQFMPDNSVNYLKSSFGLTMIHSPSIRREDELIEMPHLRKTAKKRKISGWRIMEVIPVAAILALMVMNPSVLVTINRQVANLNPFARSVVIDRSDKPEPVKEQSADELKPSADITIDTAKNGSQFELPASQAPVIRMKPDLIAENEKEEVRSQPVEEKPAPVALKEEVKVVVKPEIKPEAKSVAVNKPVNKSGKQYHIIGGCFRVDENAQKFLDQSLSDGYKAAIIGKNKNGLTMVSLYTTADATDATNELAALKEKTGGQVWLFRN